jgi:hypothetical protein
MSADNADADRQGGLRLMFILGGIATLIFLLGFGVIYYISYVQ